MRIKQYENKSKKMQTLLGLLVMFSTLILGIGYASVSDIELMISGDVATVAQDGVFITSVEFEESSGDGTERSNINDYYGTLLNSTINLSSSDKTSAITYNVTVYNNSEENYFFTGIFYDGESETFYSNNDIAIEYNSEDIQRGYELEKNSFVTFRITFKYIEDDFTITDNVLNSYINLKFEKELKILITFDANEGVVEPSTKTVYFRETYGDLPNPTRAGYIFDGWYTGISEGTLVTSNDTVNIKEEQTLYANWTPNEYTLNFNPNGGECDIKTKTVVYDSEYGELPTPTKTAYKFDGWYTSKTSGTKITSTDIVDIVEDVELYAQWEALPVAINNVPTITMTQDEAKEYYGQIVDNINGSAFNPNSNDTRTWRIFYIDTENKYGDGKGTIYLKADEDSSKLTRFSTSYAATETDGYTSVFNILSNTRYYKIQNNNIVNSSGTVIDTLYLKLNPTYAAGRKGISSTVLYEAEKAAAYLCDKTQFEDYVDDRVNYAVGSPPVEMWIDSWNSVYGSEYMMYYRYNVNVDGTTDSQKLPGYQFKINDGEWAQADSDTFDIATIDTTGLYESEVGMWMASPSIVYKGGSLVRLSSLGFVGNATINMNYAYSPVVSLNSECFVYTEEYN